MNLVTLLDIDWTNPQMLMLMGVGIMAIVLYSLTMKRRRRGAAGFEPNTSESSQLHNSRLQTQARDDINELMVRLEELSREICGQVDTRYAKLEHLLARAQRTLDALNAAAAAPVPPVGKATPLAAPPPGDPRHTEIYDLSQQGITTIDLARRMNMTLGEIELVLSLERSRRQAMPAETTRQSPSRTAGLDARA